MYCRKCGAQVGDTDIHCANCGESLGAPPQAAAPFRVEPVMTSQAFQTPNIPTYMGWSIASLIVTLFCCCCFPIGIVPLIYSSIVGSRMAAGDYERAAAASRNARMWCWISLAAVLVSIVVQIVWMVILIKSGQFHQMLQQMHGSYT